MLTSRYCVYHVLITNATFSLSELVALDCTQCQEIFKLCTREVNRARGTIVGFHISPNVRRVGMVAQMTPPKA